MAKIKKDNDKKDNDVSIQSPRIDNRPRSERNWKQLATAYVQSTPLLSALDWTLKDRLHKLKPLGLP